MLEVSQRSVLIVFSSYSADAVMHSLDKPSVLNAALMELARLHYSRSWVEEVHLQVTITEFDFASLLINLRGNFKIIEIEHLIFHIMYRKKD